MIKKILIGCSLLVATQIIGPAWSHPLAVAHAEGMKLSDISGRYIRETEDERSILDVKQLPEGKVHVRGLSLWGINRESGPHTGDLDFKAKIKNRRVIFLDRHPMGKGEKYKLELIFRENGLTAMEKNSLGYFGLNVSFKGEYRKQ